MTKIRPIAMYLPQFHPIPENDKWWGKGFTEWTNVAKARPLFKGHYQPHLPADLGFYDLRLPEVREAQAQVARDCGIYGFCYYHYWFNGKRLLNRPIDEIIASKQPDFPFMLCWANENWTRVWDGQDKDVLIGQDYSLEDYRSHMEFLCRNVFYDKRYIKVKGKPIFALYRSDLVPDCFDMTNAWRQIARENGFPDLYLLKVESGNDRSDPALLGFDAAVEFQPNWINLPARIRSGIIFKILHKFEMLESPFKNNSVFNYIDLAEKALCYKIPDYKYYRCITPSWDNSSRKKKRAHIFINSTPEAYGKWLDNIVQIFKPYSEEENFIFINAWNEWGEGNHLEPCQKWGTEYLKATMKILKGYTS